MVLRSTLVLAGLLIASSTAVAQGCIIDTDRPPQLKGAKINIGKMADESGVSKMSEKPAHLKRTAALLVEDRSVQRIENQIGRYYLLGKLYSIWLSLSMKEVSPFMQRDALGLAGNPRGMHDLYYAIDSAFKQVETLNASCADSTTRYRQSVAGMAYNDAKELLEAGNNDSAVFLARRALIVDPKGAAPWNILAEANQRRGDTAGFKEALRMVAQSTDVNPAMVRVREQALYNLGVMDLLAAAKAEGQTRRELATNARNYLEKFLTLKPDDPRGMGGLSQAFQLLGDTAASKALMGRMLSNPDAFTSGTLFEAAFGAFNAGGLDEAIQLYELGLKKNPYHRDGWFSLTSALITRRRFDEAVVASGKLLQIDPTSVPNYTQALNAWRGVAQEGKNEALKEIAADSAIYYAGRRTDAPVSVEMRPDFHVTADGASLPGVLQNRSDAAKSYRITFEFLNASGSVVGTEEVTVADVPAKTGKPFTVSGKGAGIVAWRYKPVQ